MTNEESNDILRSYQCELNILSRSDGSALLCEGKTSVLVSVCGPVEVKVQKMLIEKATIEAFFRPKSGLPGVGDRMREDLLRNVCEVALVPTLHPRTAINIVVQEMHDSGGLNACAINACCLALINSGLAMKFLVGAVTCILTEDEDLSLNPESPRPPNATFMFAFDSVKRNVVASHTTGKYTEDQYMEALHKCKEASPKIFEFFQNVVVKYTNKLGISVSYL